MQELLQTTQELVEKSEVKMAMTQITTEPQVYLTTYAATTAPTLAQAPITYAAVAQQYEKNAHAEVIVRGTAADKQILVQRNRNGTSNADDTLLDLTEKELVTKANMALDLMGWEGLDKP